MMLSARKQRFPFSFPQLQSCLWEALGIIYNREQEKTLQTPVSIHLKSFWKPKATAPFGISRAYEQQIKPIQPSGKKSHGGVWANFLVTCSHSHNFSFAIILMYLRTCIHNSYPCFKCPPLREPIQITDTFVSRIFQTVTGKRLEDSFLQSEGCTCVLYELLMTSSTSKSPMDTPGTQLLLPRQPPFHLGTLQ